MASLLYELPASPQVHSAAYQALATMPAVRVEGPATDPRGRSGIAVTFLLQGDQTPRSRLIVDPNTSKVLAVAVNDVVEVVLESGWTDTKPSPPSTE